MRGEPWSATAAWQWYRALGTVKGVNYVPSYAVNTIEWWSDATFDLDTLDRELGYAKRVGFTDVRCNLQVVVWERERELFIANLRRFLDVCGVHGLRVMLCIFDDCNFSGEQTQSYGLQKPPIPGVHNSRWVSCPAPPLVNDMAYRQVLEKFVKTVVSAFAHDSRISAWDLYNEPGNHGMGNRSQPLVEAVFRWARDVNPDQPLTAGLWRKTSGQQAGLLIQLSDFITFHNYDVKPVIEDVICSLKQYGRPVLCTETIRRQQGKTFGDLLPVFCKESVGWFSWGLVAGKQQTYLPWEKDDGSIDDPWHWDLLYPDGRAYDTREVALISSFVFGSGADETESENRTERDRAGDQCKYQYGLTGIEGQGGYR